MLRTTFLLLAASTFPAPAVSTPLRVRVVDSLGESVAGARVEVRRAGAPVLRAATGADGEAGFAIAPPVEIAIEATGFQPLRQRVETASEATLVLHPAIVRTSVDVLVRDAPDTTALVGTNLDIERTGARTVLDAVENVVPGAFVTRRGVMGYGISTNGTGGISIRGIGESPNTGVLVVVDGRPDFQGLMSHPLPDFYSLSDAGQVSVVEGPASVLYGSNAMGGVVEVKNWTPSEGMSTRLTSSFGSYNTGQHHLSHGARFERGYYSANAGVSHTSGDRASSDFRNQDGTVTAGYDLSNAWKASVEGRYGHFHVEDPGPVTAPLSGSYANVGRGGFSANLSNATASTWGYLRGFSSYGHHYITDGFRSSDRTTGFRLDQNVALAPQLTVELGTDVVNYGGQAHNATSGLDYGDHTIATAAGFTRAQWMPLRKLRLHAGARYESNSQFGDIVAPEAGASYALTGKYSVSAEIGKGFRNPTIRELYLFPAPNAALLPERLWNYQASFQAHPASALAASVTLYYADLANMIVSTGVYPNLKLSNTGAALNRGVETAARWRVQKRVRLQSGYAYLRSTNMAAYVPAHKFNYGLDVDAGRAFLYFGGVSAGKRWTSAAHTAEMGSYTVATLKLTVPVNRHWRLFAMLDNLFDRTYEVVPGYTMPGVNAAGGVSVNF